MAKQDEARIYVQSEEEPNRMLLETKIQKDDGYQKQQGRPDLVSSNDCLVDSFF